MGKRFTDTEKWNDPWFRRLNPNEKLIFVYLCDRCTSAGFYEIDFEMIQLHTGLDISTIKDALKGLLRGIQVKDEMVWIKNFLEHQKNLPLNANNPAHKPILIELAGRLKVFKDIESKIGALKGLFRDTGIGIGNINKRTPKNPTKKDKPSKAEVIEYFLENGYNEIGAVEAFKYYEEGNWHDSKGNKVKNWKQKVRVNWFQDKYKIKNGSQLYQYVCPSCKLGFDNPAPGLKQICNKCSSQERGELYYFEQQ